MHFLVYISDYIPTERDVETELMEICQKSKINNPKQDITGLLFFHNGTFLQAMEGEQDQLENLYARLLTDGRHSNLTRMVDEPILERQFASWNMDTFNLDAQETLERAFVTRFKTHFDRLCEMESALFIDLLKEFCADKDLRSVLDQSVT